MRRNFHLELKYPNKIVYSCLIESSRTLRYCQPVCQAKRVAMQCMVLYDIACYSIIYDDIAWECMVLHGAILY